eukprot:scaffold56004_cov57-Phaeocystis_antarctica.AAC.1
MISGGPAGKARRRLAYNCAQPVRTPCTCHACTTHAPCIHHARATCTATQRHPRPPGAAGAPAQGAARGAACERQPGLRALGR